MRKLISLFILLSVAASASAKMDYWVWVDKNGVTNYAEHEPTGVANARHVTSATPFGERMNTGNADTQDAGTAGGSAQPGSTGNGGVSPDAAISKQKAAIQAKIAAIKRKNCEMGKNNLAQLESYSRIKVRDKDGKVRVLTEKEHQQKIQQAKQIIRENCSS